MVANWLLGDFGCHVACEKFMNPTICTEGAECNPIQRINKYYLKMESFLDAVAGVEPVATLANS